MRYTISTGPFGIAVSLALFTILAVLGAPAPAIAEPAVKLGTAGNYVILSQAGISTTGATTIVGNIGVSPIASTAITGFALVLDASRAFSKSHLVTGYVYAANYAAPTPARLTVAIGDMQTAYTNAAGRTNPMQINLGAGNIGGKTITQGLYKWTTGVTIPANVTLSGGANAVWIFQIAGTLNISSGKMVLLAGGAQSRNIFWQVAGNTTLGTTAVFNGTILGKTAIVIMTGAKLNGRALAQTAVTLDANAITLNANPIVKSPPGSLLDSIGPPCLPACSSLSLD
jgi:hypothetical protein